MDTSQILKELEEPEAIPEQAKVNMDLSQLQGALILIQDALANQQKIIIELSRTTNGISNSASAAHRDLINKLDCLPNKLDKTYSDAVSSLSQIMKDKIDNDNRMAVTITSAKNELTETQVGLKSAVDKVSNAAKKVEDILDTTDKLAKKVSLDRCLSYIFLIAFVIWLAHLRFTNWGNEFMTISTAIIVIASIFARYLV